MGGSERRTDGQTAQDHSVYACIVLTRPASCISYARLRRAVYVVCLLNLVD